MLSLIRIYKAGLGSDIVVNELTGVLKYPVRRFEWTQPTRGDDLPKLATAGMHDRYKDVEAMAIEMEGDILGNETDDYWVNRKALLAVVIPTNDHIYRYHGHLQIKLDGDGETYWCNVDLDEYDAPLEAFYPTRTPFLFQWTNNFGYWRKLSDNSIAYI